MPFHYKIVVVCFLFLTLGNFSAFSQCPPPDPFVTGDASCTPISFTLNAINSPDTYNWYTDSIGGSPIFQGDYFSTPVLNATTTYYVTSYDSFNDCESERIPVQAVILPNSGSPALFGSNQWLAYCFDGISWTNYKGFYTDNNTSINTASLWNPLLSPNNGSPQVTSYIGCPVALDNHSISYKRQGFPVGVYRIDILNHNDDFTLLINGVEILTRVGFGQNYPSVWIGQLDGFSQIEYKWLNRTGPSSATVNLVNIPTPTDLYAGRIVSNQAYCLTGDPSPFSDSTALTADRNAYIGSSQPVYNATPPSGELMINAYPADSVLTTYLSFDVSSIRSTTFNNAFLYLHTYDFSDYPNTTIFVSSTDTTWDENNISWANQPVAAPSPLAATPIYDINGQWYKLDVSSFILAERNAGHNRVSFLLTDTTLQYNPLVFYSKETAYPPILVLNNAGKGCSVYSYQWQASTLCTNSWNAISGANGASYDPPGGLTDSTCYRLQLTDGCGNVAYSNTLHVNIDPQTIAGTLAVTEIDLNKGTIQINGEQGSILHWEVSQTDFASDSTKISSSATQINYTGSTTSDLYYRALIKSGACPSIYSDTVKILKVQEFFIFNSFSPNGDGINDTWKIGGIERYPDNKVSIVNFMGVPIYEASHYNNEDVVWNGSHGGQSLPDGTYYYSIQIPDQSTRTGYVIIKR